LQPKSQNNNKFSRVKKLLFGPKNEDKSSNRQSKVVSICSYENINFAPLAKPESMSDINNHDDSIIENSFKSSILRLNQENNREEINQNDNEVATSTPRNGKEMLNLVSNSINLTSPEFNCTSLSMLNAQINLDSSDLTSAKQYNSTNSVDHLTFSISTNSKINDLENTSLVMDDTNYSSIEKLEILKPKSKDYILCFNTSVDSSIKSNKEIQVLIDDEKQFGKNSDSGIDIRNTGSIYSNCK
jgi:hypothetical protein